MNFVKHCANLTLFIEQTDLQSHNDMKKLDIVSGLIRMVNDIIRKYYAHNEENINMVERMLRYIQVRFIDDGIHGFNQQKIKLYKSINVIVRCLKLDFQNKSNWDIS